MGAVAALVADAEPPGPVAVTVAASVCPTSVAAGVYVVAVAPVIGAPFPAHWYAKEVAFVQTPVDDVRTFPA